MRSHNISVNIQSLFTPQSAWYLLNTIHKADSFPLLRNLTLPFLTIPQHRKDKFMIKPWSLKY